MARASDPGIEGAGVRVVLIASRFNPEVCEPLLAGAQEGLRDHGVVPTDQQVVRVPGAWEIPLAAARIARRGGVDAIVAIGALIRGETAHFDLLVAQSSQGLMRVSLESGLPIGFGILTTDTLEQALARAGGSEGNKGRDAALAALEMVQLFRQLG